MNKNGLLTAVGLGAAAIGVIVGASSKKVQAGVAAGKTLVRNAWNGLVDRFKKNEETSENSEKENVEVVDAEEVDNFDPVE